MVEFNTSLWLKAKPGYAHAASPAVLLSIQLSLFTLSGSWVVTEGGGLPVPVCIYGGVTA